jgi:hypothetical protein
MKHESVLSLLSIVVAFVPASAGGEPPAPAQPSQPPPSFEEQVAEYIRLFPYQLTNDYTVRFTGGDPRNLNRWAPGGEPTLVAAGDDVVPRTNNDTFYKGAALDLRSEPVVLGASASADDRFYSFQLIDDRNVNYRNIIAPAGKYTLYFGERPAEIEGEAIEAPSAMSVVIARVEVEDKRDAEDLAAAKAVYDGTTLSGIPPSEFSRLDLLSAFSADVAVEAHRRMDEAFATVPFKETVVGPGQAPGRDVPYLLHSAGTKGGWGAAEPEHSSYEAILFDADGEEMKGSSGPYSVTTELPPVDAFWSVTVYDTERGGYLHPNAANRYHYNGTTAARNADGTVTVTFKRTCSAADGNCLEVPVGRFDVAVRYYRPRAEIVSGKWQFPRIRRVVER